MQCGKCGTPVPEGASVCPVCGAPLSSAAPGDGFFKRPGNIGSDGFSLSEEPVSPAYSPAPSPAPSSTFFCPACGTELPANTKFCTACGAPSPFSSTGSAERLSNSGVHVNMGPRSSESADPAGSAPPSGGYTYTPPGSVPPAPPAPPAGGYYGSSAAPAAPDAGSAVSLLRKACGSPLFLVTAILFSMLALLNVISNSKTLFPALGNLDQLSWALGLDSSFSALLVVLLLFAMLEGIVFPILWTVGMWLLFGSSKSLDGRFSTGGLTTVKVTEIIALILECATIGGFLAWYIYQIIDLLDYWDWIPGENKAQMIGIFVGLAVALFFIILYRAKVIHTVSTSAANVRYRSTPSLPASFVGVGNIIMAVILVFFPFLMVALVSSLIGYSVSLGDLLRGIDALTMFAYILAIAVRIMFAVVTFAARNTWYNELRR